MHAVPKSPEMPKQQPQQQNCSLLEQLVAKTSARKQIELKLELLKRWVVGEAQIPAKLFALGPIKIAAKAK
ncbi:unnamed protein product [Prunus armeniaca]